MASSNVLNYPLAELIGREVKRRRVEARMSQVALAERCFISGPSICVYEKGDTCPSLNSLCALAIALDCDPGDLLPTGDELRAVMGPTA